KLLGWLFDYLASSAACGPLIARLHRAGPIATEMQRCETPAVSRPLYVVHLRSVDRFLRTHPPAVTSSLPAHSSPPVTSSAWRSPCPNWRVRLACPRPSNRRQGEADGS